MVPLEFYRTYFPVKSASLLRALASASVPAQVHQGELLLREGEPQTQLPLLVSGIIRGFYFDVNGQEITDCFAVRPGIPVVAGADFCRPSPIYLDALTDCELMTIPTQEVVRLLDQYPELLRLYNQMLVDSFTMHWEIKTTRCRSTAMQRYQWFLRTYPGLIHRISSKCVASFLGMTPVTLSRLRRALREQQPEE